MNFVYNKLRGRVVEICGTQEEFAKRMKLSKRTVSLKMQGKIFWTQEDITKACDVLDISAEQIPDYFFALKV